MPSGVLQKTLDRRRAPSRVDILTSTPSKNEGGSLPLRSLTSPLSHSFEMGSEFKSLVHSLNHALTVPTKELDHTVSKSFSPPPGSVPLPVGASDINAVVLTGSGRAFSAGGSLPFLYSRTATPSHLNSSTMYNFYTNFLSLRTLPIPTVAAINGPAVGAGACVTLACDSRLASDGAKVAFNFCRLGIHPGMGGSHYLPTIIPRSSAFNLLASGRMVAASESLSLGLVDAVHPSDSFLERSIEAAEAYASSSPVAVRGLVRTMRAQQDRGLEEALRREADQQALCYAREDWKEGLDAVMEKREPVFDVYNSS